MSIVIRTAPYKDSTLKGKRVYRQYLTWLIEVFEAPICAYCFKVGTNLDIQIDHYEPKTMPNSAGDSPQNLILACSYCNETSKNDYHPLHSQRNTLKHDVTNHMVMNCLNEDLSALLNLSNTSFKISPKNPANTRAAWNVAMFSLQTREDLSSEREGIKTAIFYLKQEFEGFQALGVTWNGIPTKKKDAILHLIEIIRKRKSMFEALGLSIPHEVISLAKIAGVSF